MKLAVVVLAGGEGSRMGGDKPLRMLGGKRLIDRAAEFARSWSEVIAVAVRNPGQAGAVDLECIVDEEGIDGPLAGLAAALRFAQDAGCQGVLTIPADMPFLPPELGQRLAAGIGGAGAAIAGSGGELHPVCALWKVSASGTLLNYLATGRRSLRGFAEAVGLQRVDWPVDPVDPFFNINSPADLATAERLLHG